MRSSRLLILALPCAVIALNVMVWITGLSRSGFWADDFLNLTHFSHSLGHLSDNHINTGKYVINVYWAVGTEAFGAGSVVPFLLLNSLVFASGVALWLWAGTGKRWSAIDAWWIGGLFLATAAWLPTALWSTNVTHSFGFLALGGALWAHERSSTAPTSRATLGWSLAGGAFWTLAVVSNLLYIGLLTIAAYCAWHQVRKLHGMGVPAFAAGARVVLWNLLLPILYFVLVAYPGTTSSAVYAQHGLSFLHENLDFYRSVLAPTNVLVALYVVLMAAGAVGALLAARRGDLFPLAVLAAAGATALPALVQGLQRDVHYLAMPLMLLFSALAATARPLLHDASKRVNGAVLLVAAVALLLTFGQGSGERSYFVETPYGHDLAAFRSEVAALTPPGGAICAKLKLDAAQQAYFIAAMSGPDGFLIPPINAQQVYFATDATRCPANVVVTRITVSSNAHGGFAVSA